MVMFLFHVRWNAFRPPIAVAGHVSIYFGKNVQSRCFRARTSTRRKGLRRVRCCFAKYSIFYIHLPITALSFCIPFATKSYFASRITIVLACARRHAYISTKWPHIFGPSSCWCCCCWFTSSFSLCKCGIGEKQQPCDCSIPWRVGRTTCNDWNSLSIKSIMSFSWFEVGSCVVLLSDEDDRDDDLSFLGKVAISGGVAIIPYRYSPCGTTVVRFSVGDVVISLFMTMAGMVHIENRYRLRVSIQQSLLFVFLRFMGYNDWFLWASYPRSK